MAVFFVSLVTPSGKRTRRRFRKLGAEDVLAWLRSIWQIRRDEGTWNEKLGPDETSLIDRMLAPVFDGDCDDEQELPRDDREVLERVREHLDADAEEHFFRAHDDDLDDEGTEIEMYVFDSRFLREPEALDRLPHPDRGAKRDPAEDRYRRLLERVRARAEA